MLVAVTACLWAQGCFTYMAWQDTLASTVKIKGLYGTVPNFDSPKHEPRIYVVSYEKGDRSYNYAISGGPAGEIENFKYHGIFQDPESIFKDLDPAKKRTIANFLFSETSMNLGRQLIAQRAVVPALHQDPLTQELVYRWSGARATVHNDLALVRFHEQPVYVIADDGSDRRKDQEDKNLMAIILPARQPQPAADRKKDIGWMMLKTPLVLACDCFLSPIAFCLGDRFPEAKRRAKSEKTEQNGSKDKRNDEH